MRKDMGEGFNFTDGERVFTCTVAAPGVARTEAWWWFQVSTERSPQRYAPFRHALGDTHYDVQQRIVAYYDDLLARRAAISTTPYWRRGRPTTPAAPASAATTDSTTPHVPVGVVTPVAASLEPTR
jgi:hypothetical protein